MRVDVKASDTEWGLEVTKGTEVKRRDVGIWQETHAMLFNTVCSMLIRLFKAAYRNKALAPTRFHVTTAKADLFQSDNWVVPCCIADTLLIPYKSFPSRRNDSSS